jgi:hypothetical protein
MLRWNQPSRLLLAALLLASAAALQTVPVFSQEQPASDASPAAQQAPDPLEEDELEVLVARIALYPDELVAVISEASLYPLQVVEASRFLDKLAKDKSLNPKETWDGSVVSLLNYPEIVTMMSDDLEWTQALGDALTYQQKDVLIAIQQLRDKAVASGVIKSDDKMTVVQENDNVVIQSASAERIYVPQYAPEMLYQPDYHLEPIGYYADSYPNYYYPTATFFAAAVTGVVWGAAMDWDNWGVWGGRWDGRDVDIDCNNCFNNIKGKVNFNDVDWKNVDRSKIKFDRDQFKKVDRSAMRDRVKADGRNNLRTKAAEVRRDRPSALPARSGKVADVRKIKIQDGLKAKSGIAKAKPGIKNANIDRAAARKASPGVARPAGKPRPAARVDNRPRQPSGLGNVGSGKRQQIASKRGGQAMGGGNRAKGRAMSGGRRPPPSGGARRGGGGGRRR